MAEHLLKASQKYFGEASATASVGLICSVTGICPGRRRAPPFGLLAVPGVRDLGYCVWVTSPAPLKTCSPGERATLWSIKPETEPRIFHISFHGLGASIAFCPAILVRDQRLLTACSFIHLLAPCTWLSHFPRPFIFLFLEDL